MGYDRIETGREEIRVVGEGLLIGWFVLPGETSHEEFDFPFRFDVVLDRDLRVIRRNSVRVDLLSSYVDACKSARKS